MRASRRNGQCLRGAMDEQKPGRRSRIAQFRLRRADATKRRMPSASPWASERLSGLVLAHAWDYVQVSCWTVNRPLFGR